MYFMSMCMMYVLLCAHLKASINLRIGSRLVVVRIEINLRHTMTLLDLVDATR